MVESLFVTDNLDSDGFARAVIPALENLAKRALTESINDFVAIRKVIPDNHQVVASFVVVTIVVGRAVPCRLLLFAASTDAIHILIVEDLPTLIVGQVNALGALQYAWITWSVKVGSI